MAKFEIYKGGNDEFYFRLLAGNGQNILRSEGYKAKSSCTNGIESVKKNSQDDDRFARKESSNGKFYFSLLASNGQIIGSSEMYESEKSRDNGIESVKKNAPDAEVDDLTD
ncbi:MAG: YegP family protein [Bacteroidia bacterium]